MRKDLTVFAALVAASLAATPLVMSASNASATVEDGMNLRTAIAPVEVAPVAAPPTVAAPCLRKVRVVYGGYGTPEAACRD